MHLQVHQVESAYLVCLSRVRILRVTILCLISRKRYRIINGLLLLLLLMWSYNGEELTSGEPNGTSPYKWTRLFYNQYISSFWKDTVETRLCLWSSRSGQIKANKQSDEESRGEATDSMKQNPRPEIWQGCTSALKSSSEHFNREWMQ